MGLHLIIRLPFVVIAPFGLHAELHKPANYRGLNIFYRSPRNVSGDSLISCVVDVLHIELEYLVVKLLTRCVPPRSRERLGTANWKS